MRWLLYLRLFTLTAGTLLPFFWMVVILGHRRQRNFERVFFFLCLTLTCFFGSSLLAINAQLFYAAPPLALLWFAWIFVCLGLWFTPPLALHLHVEYASLRGLLDPTVKRVWMVVAWVPAVLLGFGLSRAIRPMTVFDFEHPTHLLGLSYQVWLTLAIAFGAFWQYRFKTCAPDQEQKLFHDRLLGFQAILAVLLIAVFWQQRKYGSVSTSDLVSYALLSALVPLALLMFDVKHFNFLQIGRQRNLIYAVFGVFLALLYLSFVRRLGLWLEPYLPPEATAALMLFLPVFFFEPLQRLIRQLLRRTAQTEVDRAQKLMGPINEVARLGDLSKLREFAEHWIAEQLQLASVELYLREPGAPSVPVLLAKSSAEEAFPIVRSRKVLGQLRVRSHGAMISGETYAALEFVAEQLPAAFDLCRLIEQKLQLERELAERERMALVGQMAASISHNLKNPLGSIKTILQVQMENPEMPASLRGETQMVLDEINRLSAKLNQLLQFSRPTVLGAKVDTQCDVREVIGNVLNVLRPEAQRKRVRLGSRMAEGDSKIDASFEAVHDVISNLVVNAIEASPVDSEVRVELSWSGIPCIISVEDEGNGIPQDMKERVLKPFFTTKAQGTGLGLAIVAKRVAELGGELRIVSPLAGSRGTRFEVKLWPKAVRRSDPQPGTQVEVERS
jgi:signal transduction histidine kinase